MTNIDNILSIKDGVAGRFRNARRAAKISQMTMAERSGVSLGSIKRFERTGEISLSSLIKLAMVLGYEEDFNELVCPDRPGDRHDGDCPGPRGCVMR